MSHRIGLFYSLRTWNCVSSIFMFYVHVYISSWIFFFCILSYEIRIIFFRPINTRAHTIFPDHNGRRCNGNEELVHTPQRSRNVSLTLKQEQTIKNVVALNQSVLGCSRGVMVKAMDCGIVVSEFVFLSCYYVHFRANTLGKGMSPLILPAMF